jgi:hypothetical protein
MYDDWGQFWCFGVVVIFRGHDRRLIRDGTVFLVCETGHNKYNQFSVPEDHIDHSQLKTVLLS